MTQTTCQPDPRADWRYPCHKPYEFFDAIGAICIVAGALFLLLLMNIAIVGSGYVGLVTGACFADVGHHVICVDNDQRKIAAL
jgi:pyruvate/2-oxoglutarate dehydrogenase complex dihydrolipoamide dehydrogenase (E3) component